MLTELVERVREGGPLTDGLVEEPDCLADMPLMFSVFRFRYTWGTVYEVTLAATADAADRNAAFGVLPPGCTFINCFDTMTLGTVAPEFTIRFLTATV